MKKLKNLSKHMIFVACYKIKKLRYIIDNMDSSSLSKSDINELLFIIY